MTEKEITALVEGFLVRFNEMCKTERKDLLQRTATVNYEHGSRLKTYKVKHRLKKGKGVWNIEAVSSGFWIFRKRFPLLSIYKWKNNKIKFLGMYTHNITEFDVSELESKLDLYLTNCKNQSNDTFTQS